jgi:hypothetical protein
MLGYLAGTDKSGCPSKKTPYISHTSLSNLSLDHQLIAIPRTTPYSPIRAPKYTRGAGHRIHLPSIRLDANPCCVPHAQQMIRDLEPLIPSRIVRAADVHAGLELALRMVAQEGEHGDDASGGDVQRKLVAQDGELLDEFGEALEEVGAVGVEAGCGFAV